MGLTLPSLAAPWLAHSAVEWPEVDEDDLSRQAHAWTAFAEAGEAHTDQASAAVTALMADNWTFGLKGFELWFMRMTGPTGHMPTAVLTCRMMSATATLAAGYVIAMKVAILASLPALAVLYYSDQPEGNVLETLSNAPRPLAEAVVTTLRQLVDSTVSGIEGLGTEVAEFVGEVVSIPVVVLGARPIHQGRERIGGHLAPIAERLHHADTWPKTPTDPRRFPDRNPPNSVLKRYSKRRPDVLESYAEYDADGYVVRRVDLIGRPHMDGPVPVAPPHTQFYERNIDRDGTVHVKSNRTDVRPATPEETP